MHKHVKNALSEGFQTKDKIYTTPSDAKLFVITENVERLDSDQTEKFFNLVAVLLYIAQKFRYDIATPSLLSTRTSCSTRGIGLD